MKNSPTHEVLNVPTPGKGKLIYLIGASGSGKDSIMCAALALAPVDSNLMIAPRYMTRPNANEPHEISESDFHMRLKAQSFLFHWQAHGYYYGIEKAVIALVEKGWCVMVNGSRAYAEQAKRKHPAVKIIGIDACPESISSRLQNRARENAMQTAERLQRNAKYHLSLDSAEVVVNNSDSLDQAARHLMSAMEL